MNTTRYADKPSGGGRRRSLWKGPALFTAILLPIPLAASYFVDGWHWHPGAYVVLGALLFGVGFTYELVTWKMDAIAYRAAVGIAFAAVFSLAWGNLVQWADVTPAAAMYFGVPMVGLIGAAMARLRPNGMARALFVTASVQVLVLAAAMIFLMTRNPEVSTWTAPEWRGFGGNAILAMLFAGSALLFRKAGHAPDESAPFRRHDQMVKSQID